MTAPLLDLHVRRKRYGAREVLADVHLRLRPGEIVALVGASGCGKSTLLRLAAGLDTDYQGEVRLDGRAVTEPTRDIGFVFQEPRLFPWLTVADNVAFDLGASAARSPRVRALLAEVGLEGHADAWPKELSGGQAQRAALARGLATQPRLLLLDEPFSAVDAFTRMKLQDLLTSLVKRHGITVLMVTHDVDEAVYLSDRVLLLESDPGTLREEYRVPAPRPRRRDDITLAPARGQILRGLQAVHAL